MATACQHCVWSLGLVPGLWQLLGLMLRLPFPEEGGSILSRLCGARPAEGSAAGRGPPLGRGEPGEGPAHGRCACGCGGESPPQAGVSSSCEDPKLGGTRGPWETQVSPWKESQARGGDGNKQAPAKTSLNNIQFKTRKINPKSVCFSPSPCLSPSRNPPAPGTMGKTLRFPGETTLKTRESLCFAGDRKWLHAWQGSGALQTPCSRMLSRPRRRALRQRPRELPGAPGCAARWGFCFPREFSLNFTAVVNTALSSPFPGPCPPPEPTSHPAVFFLAAPKSHDGGCLDSLELRRLLTFLQN